MRQLFLQPAGRAIASLPPLCRCPWVGRHWAVGSRCTASSAASPAGSGEVQPAAEPRTDDQQHTMQAGGAGTDGTAFNWHQQWYPLAPVSYLSHSKPTPHALLGRHLVVWYHKPSSTWRAMEDRCPHRLAPLSEGRIEPASGNLQCSYHGWQFCPDGRCASIPQADSPQQEAAALGSKRSCVMAFPVREEQGLLWVWMDPGSAAASRLRPLPLPAELLGGLRGAGSGTLLGDWYQRDLPVSADYLLENLLDPAHVHFAHNGVIGSRDRACSIPLHLEGPLTAQGGFCLSMSQQEQPERPWRYGGSSSHGRGNGNGTSSSGGGGGRGVSAVTHFVPPGLVWLEFPAPGGSRFSMLFYAVPVSPNSSYILAGYSSDTLPPAVQALLKSEALAPLLHAFQFLAHLGSHEVLDGDTIHIYQQGQVVRREGCRTYFTPASADRGVVLLRRWLDEFAGGGPDYLPGPPSGPRTAHAGSTGSTSARPLSRREVLDRYEQHTKSCPSCRRALGVVHAVRQALLLGSASAFAAAFTLAVVAAPLPAAPPRLASRLGRSSAPLLLGVAALMAAALQQALGRFEQQFVFVDYVHSEK